MIILNIKGSLKLDYSSPWPCPSKLVQCSFGLME